MVYLPDLSFARNNIIVHAIVTICITHSHTRSIIQGAQAPHHICFASLRAGGAARQAPKHLIYNFSSTHTHTHPTREDARRRLSRSYHDTRENKWHDALRRVLRLRLYYYYYCEPRQPTPTHNADSGAGSQWKKLRAAFGYLYAKFAGNNRCVCGYRMLVVQGQLTAKRTENLDAINAPHQPSNRHLRCRLVVDARKARHKHDSNERRDDDEDGVLVSHVFRSAFDARSRLCARTLTPTRRRCRRRWYASRQSSFNQLPFSPTDERFSSAQSASCLTSRTVLWFCGLRRRHPVLYACRVIFKSRRK